MTHLSDLTFIDRGTSIGWFVLWMVIYVFRWDKFEALHPKRIFRFELRSIVTLLLLIALPLQLTYDILSAYIKYNEGFYKIEATGAIITKPAIAWDPNNRQLGEYLDYVLTVAIALEACIFFLLQAFWNYISKSVTKSSFMSSWEFRLNITFSLVVIVVLPLLQYIFRNDHLHREAVPQLGFSIILFVIGILGIRTHFRFKSLLKVAILTMNETTQNIARKLEYFKDMNLVLTWSFFGSALSLGISSVDGLTANQTLSRKKFVSDFLVTNLNFFEFIIWVSLVLIFYPRRSGIGDSVFGSTTGQSNGQSISMPRYKNNKSVEPDYEAQNHRDDRHLSHIPYKPPANTERSGDIYYDNNDSYNYTDKHPLTKTASTEQYSNNMNGGLNNSYRDNYDDPLRRQQQYVPYQQQDQSYSPPSSPRNQQYSNSPARNSPIPRSPTSIKVGQQNFILDEPPGASNARMKAAMIQQQQQQQYQMGNNNGQKAQFYDDLGDVRPPTPARARKEPRPIPRN